MCVYICTHVHIYTFYLHALSPALVSLQIQTLPSERSECRPPPPGGLTAPRRLPLTHDPPPLQADGNREGSGGTTPEDGTDLTHHSNAPHIFHIWRVTTT